MRKKAMAIFASMLFTASSMNLMASAVALDEPNCREVADATLAAYQAAMLMGHGISTHEQEYYVWQAAFDSCGGQYDQDPVII